MAVLRELEEINACCVISGESLNISDLNFLQNGNTTTCLIYLTDRL